MNSVPCHAAVESALTVWRSVPALPPFLKHALILFWRCLGWKFTFRSIWDLWKPKWITTLKNLPKLFPQLFSLYSRTNNIFHPTIFVGVPCLENLVWCCFEEKKYFTVDIDHSMDITKPQNPFDINFYDETLTSLKFSKIIFSASQGKRVAWFIQLSPWSSFDGYLIGRKHSLVS